MLNKLYFTLVTKCVRNLKEYTNQNLGVCVGAGANGGSVMWRTKSNINY